MEDYSNLMYEDNILSLEDLKNQEDEYVNQKNGDCCSDDSFYCSFCPCRDNCF